MKSQNKVPSRTIIRELAHFTGVPVVTAAKFLTVLKEIAAIHLSKKESFSVAGVTFQVVPTKGRKAYKFYSSLTQETYEKPAKKPGYKVRVRVGGQLKQTVAPKRKAS